MSYLQGAQTWSGNGFAALDALRKPLKQLYDAADSFRKKIDDRAIARAYITKDEKENRVINNYLNTVSTMGGAMNVLGLAVLPELALLGADCIVVGATALVTIGARGYFSETLADRVLNKRRTYSKPTTYHDIPHFEVIDDACGRLANLSASIHDGETALRILDVARNLKMEKMESFFAECDRARKEGRSDEEMTRYYKIVEPSLKTPLENISKQAEAAKNAIQHAIIALEELTPSNLRGAQAQGLEKFIAEFERHTFMIPSRSNSTKTVWSEIQEMVDTRLKPILSSTTTVPPAVVNSAVSNQSPAGQTAQPALRRGLRP